MVVGFHDTVGVSLLDGDIFVGKGEGGYFCFCFYVVVSEDNIDGFGHVKNDLSLGPVFLQTKEGCLSEREKD